MKESIADPNEERDDLDAASHLPGVTWVDCHVADADGMQDVAFLRRLEEALSRTEADAHCRLIVFHRLGLTRHTAATRLPDLRMYGKREELLKRFRDLAPLSVALVNGMCSGAQFEIALSADACLATEESSFAVPELAQGCLPGMSMFRLARQIGLRLARQMMLLNGALGARDALAHRLIDTVCSAAEFPQHVHAILARTAANSLVATQLTRRLLEESYTTPYENTLGHFLAAQHRCYAKLPDAAQ